MALPGRKHRSFWPKKERQKREVIASSSGDVCVEGYSMISGTSVQCNGSYELARTLLI